MAERTLFPEWRDENEATKYPFASAALLVNRDGRVVLDGTFLDAALYPIGAVGPLYMSSVVVTHETITVVIGDTTNPSLATGTVSAVAAPDDIVLFDIYERPAGVLISESVRIGIMAAWGVGTHKFTPAQTEFAATVCFPTPEIGVRGIRLETGEVFTGDVWLVGGDGVVVRSDDTVVAGPGGSTVAAQAIRIDVVGDPLFRRRLCEASGAFTSPRFIRTIRVVGTNGSFECSPTGDFTVFAGNSLADDSVLRVTTSSDGVRFAAAGQPYDS